MLGEASNRSEAGVWTRRNGDVTVIVTVVISDGKGIYPGGH